jgi:hypothetical protein
VDCYTRPENAHKNPRNKVNQQALVATSPTRSTISCTYCQKTGHTENNCLEKRNDQNKSDDHAHVVLFLTEHSLFTKNIPKTFSPNTFIAEGMFNLRPHVTDIMVGNNEVMTSVSIGQYKGLVLGTTMDLTLKDVLYIPKLMANLFSLTKALETKGVKLSSQGQLISLIYGPHEICFGKVFKHGSGRLLGIDIHPNPNNIAVTAQTVDINTVHNIFGHPNSLILSATAQKYGFKTKHTLQVCPNCAISKAKQKNLHQITTHPSTEIGGMINIDISSVLNSSYGCANFWLLILDDFTGYLWSYFQKHKSDLPSTMIDWLYLVKKELQLAFKTIHLDNSGENMAFHKLIQFKPECHSLLHQGLHNKVVKWNVLLPPYLERPGIC